MKQNMFIYIYISTQFIDSPATFVLLPSSPTRCVVYWIWKNIFKEQFLAVVQGTYLLHADNIIIHHHRVQGFILLTPKLGKTL